MPFISVQWGDDYPLTPPIMMPLTKCFFYGGNITYHLQAEGHGIPATLQVSQYRGQMMRVATDGRDSGVIAYAPYTLALGTLSLGTHTIDITLFGCRINTFGQLHCVEHRLGYWWGPPSWRTTGAGWSDEYQPWPQGILKSPQILEVDGPDKR